MNVNILLLCFLIFSYSYSCASSLKSTDQSPSTTVLKSERANSDDALLRLVNFVFTDTESTHTNAFLILIDDQLVVEKYAHGFNRNKKHRIWSISKSISSAVIGIAEQKNIISRSNLVRKFYPDLRIKNSRKKDITIADLLGMKSGLKFNGEPTDPTSDTLRMLYGSGRSDMANYAASLPAEYDPGTNFKYSNGSTNMAMGSLRKAMNNQKAYDNFPWDNLFDPLEMEEVSWEQDSAGAFIGSSYIHMRPIDLLAFGRLYLNKGKYNNEQIVPSEYVTFSTTPVATNMGAVPLGYGAYWWLNRRHGEDHAIVDIVPMGTFYGAGTNGQYLIIIPEWNLVLVRLAEDRIGQELELGKLLPLLSNAVGEQN